MTVDNNSKGDAHGPADSASSDYANDSSPYAHRKEEEIRSFFALCLGTILLAAPFGLAVVLLERPFDDPILISVYFWLALAALIYYPFMILRSPADIYIADAYDDTASRSAKLVGILLFAYALMWGANLLMLTNSPPWRTAQGPLARIEIVETDKWTEDRYYEFRFQLSNVPGWFHYRDPDQERIQQIFDSMVKQAERGGPFIMEDDAEDTVTPEGPVPIAEAVEKVQKAASEKNAKTETATETAAAEGTDTAAAAENNHPARLSVGFRADHGWVNAIAPPAWAFLGRDTRMDVKALMLNDNLIVFDKSRSLGLRITSLIWFVMCVMAGSASMLAAKLRSLKGQEAEASKRSLMSKREAETRAFEARLAEMGLDEHLTEIQKSALINPVRKKQDRPQ